jgi:hypothetical protein
MGTARCTRPIHETIRSTAQAITQVAERAPRRASMGERRLSRVLACLPEWQWHDSLSWLQFA